MRACARGAVEGGQRGGVALSHIDESCAVCVWTGSGKDGCGDEERGAKERLRCRTLKGSGRATQSSDVSLGCVGGVCGVGDKLICPPLSP